MRLRSIAVTAVLCIAAVVFGPGTEAMVGDNTGIKFCTSHGKVRWSPLIKRKPNHKLFKVRIRFDEGEHDGDTLRLEVKSITHDEVGKERGATARHSPDWMNQDVSASGPDGPPEPPAATEVAIGLRNERLGTGNGRIYTIEVQCTDTGDVTREPPETGTQLLHVSIPHDSGR